MTALPLDVRVGNLERELSRLRAQVEHAGPRTLAATRSIPVRLARTVEANQSYPAAGSDTYPIKFLDCEYPADTVGQLTPTVAERSQDYRTTAHNLIGGDLPYLYPCHVAQLPNGQWTIVNPPRCFIARVNDNGVTAAVGVTPGVGMAAIYRMVGGAVQAIPNYGGGETEVTVYNLTPAFVPAQRFVLIHLEDGSGRWVIHDGCPCPSSSSSLSSGSSLSSSSSCSPAEQITSPTAIYSPYTGWVGLSGYLQSGADAVVVYWDEGDGGPTDHFLGTVSGMETPQGWLFSVAHEAPAPNANNCYRLVPYNDCGAGPESTVCVSTSSSSSSATSSLSSQSSQSSGSSVTSGSSGSGGCNDPAGPLTATISGSATGTITLSRTGPSSYSGSNTISNGGTPTLTLTCAGGIWTLAWSNCGSASDNQSGANPVGLTFSLAPYCMAPLSVTVTIS